MRHALKLIKTRFFDRLIPRNLIYIVFRTAIFSCFMNRLLYT